MFLKSITQLLSDKYTSSLQRDSINELILREFPEELNYILRTELQEKLKQSKAKMEVYLARLDKLKDRQKSEKMKWKEVAAQIKELVALMRSYFVLKQELVAFNKRMDAEFKVVNARLFNEVAPREAYYKLCQLTINWDHWVRLQIIPLVSACKLITGVNPEPAEHTIDESDMGRYSKTRPAWVNLYDQAVSAEKAQLLAVTREHEGHKGEVSLHEFVNFIHRNKQSDAKYPWTVPGELQALFKMDEAEESLKASERKSLQKILLGMAIAKYGFVPGQDNTCTGKNNGSIYADLDQNKLNVDPKTIKKYLDEAAERFQKA